MNRVEQQPAFILKSQAFNETSSIHQLFTKEFGVLSVVSKGSRTKKSKQGSLLQPFNALIVSWSGKSELKTLTGVEQAEYIPNLIGKNLFCGFYINELILNLVHKHDEHPELFNLFELILRKLAANEDIEINLRKFEKGLLEEIGYGLVLNADAQTGRVIENNKFYRYLPEQGAVEVNNEDASDTYNGSMLLNLQHDTLSDVLEMRQAKRLMRSLIDYQLGGKILKSRELFKQIKAQAITYEK